MDNCAICLEALETKQTHTLDCDHCFHTECQIEWFRRGQTTCPTCRSGDNTSNSKLAHNRTAFQIMSNRARRADAPPELKRAYNSYRKYLTVLQQCVKDTNAFKKKRVGDFANSDDTFVDLQKQYSLIRRKHWRTRWKVHRLKREISCLCEVVTIFSR